MLKAGQLLREARLKKGLSLEDVAEATKIRLPFVAAIEEGQYDKLPSPAYAKGFVTNYAQFLGLQSREIMALFRREFDERKAYRVLPENLVEKSAFSGFRIRISQVSALFFVFLLFVLLFLMLEFRFILFPPALSVSVPKEGALVSSQVVVQGKTDAGSTVFVNGEAVAVADSGEFKKSLVLFPGREVITITAQNRLGKKTSIQRVVEVK